MRLYFAQTLRRLRDDISDMPAVREQRQTTRKEKSKPSARAKSSISFKSAEVVTDSDDTDGIDALPLKSKIVPEIKSCGTLNPLHKNIYSAGKNVEKIKSRRSISPDTESATTDGSQINGRSSIYQDVTDTESSSDSKEPTPVPVQRNLPPSSRSTLVKSALKAATDRKEHSKKKTTSPLEGSSEVEVSDDESGGDAVDGSPNHSDENDSSESESEEAEPAQKVAALERSKLQQVASTSSSSIAGDAVDRSRGHSDENDSNESESEEVEPAQRATASERHTTPQATSQSGPSTAQSTYPPFEPPPGFGSTNISFSPSSFISENFAPANLKGKQIWHITAPDSVPLASIKQISRQSILEGSTVLSHQGTDYGLVSDLADSDCSQKILLVPSSNINQYHSSRTPIARTLHLQQLVKLPSRTANSQSSTNGISSPPKRTYKPRIEQPKCLKMRSHAFGVAGAGASDSESGSESENIHKEPHKVPQFIHPDAPRSSKKRKNSEVTNGVLTPPTTAMKPQKKSRPVTNSTISASPEAPGKASLLPDNPLRDDGDGPTPSHTATPATKMKESKEERAKRKAEKHQKKLLQPFRVPRSASPARGITNGLDHREDVVMANGYEEEEGGGPGR